MRQIFLIQILVLFFASCAKTDQETKESSKTATSSPKVVLVIHGGAGNISRKKMSSEKQEAYEEKMKEALLAGYSTIKAGGESCQAVINAITIMEDSPLFNAGVGAVLTANGENELDASIMRGKDRNAGAVASVKTIKSPIKASYEVMENSPHVMLTGLGAEQFAKERNLAIVDSGYFTTERRKAQLEKIQTKEHGTVGAVALDTLGNLCAGTSTGGMTNKKWGRIGDSPIIGAGTYANNQTCGVSATGYGEYFIRSVSAYDVSALMSYKGYTVDQAATEVIQKTDELGGPGGMIALDHQGNVSTPFSTTGMFRGYVTIEGEIVVMIDRN